MDNPGMADLGTRPDASVTLPPGVAPAAVSEAPPSTAAPGSAGLRRDVQFAALILASVLAVCIIGYLASAIPGSWFPGASPKAWTVNDLTLARGSGNVVGDELLVSAPDANGIALVTAVTDLRSSDYPGVAWIVAGLREDADVRLLWRTDVQPDKLNSVALHVEAGRTLASIVAKNPAWIGHITGIALAIHGPLAQPVHIRGVVAKPMGAPEIVRDRLHEWFAFEAWNGASINTVVGGSDNQDVPLPAVLALVLGISALVVVLIRRWRPGTFSAATPAIVAGFFLAGWLMLDARWMWNLLRQEPETAARYAGKDLRGKHLANEDGPLFAFVEKALAAMPKTAVRIFVAADADYFRGRAAYHLYPHSVYFDPRSDALPTATTFHAGDWLLVFQRRGIQFDKSLGKLRWDGNQTVDAELKLVAPGGALFVIR
jgi:hypothetical protein